MAKAGKQTNTVRCKFICNSITKSLSSKAIKDGDKYKYVQVPLDTANFVVVSSGSEENEKFFSATPTGTLHIGTFEPDVFEIGKMYYIDIVKAE